MREAGMEYVNIPVVHETMDDETFERFGQLMTDPDRCPALMHCSSADQVRVLPIPTWSRTKEKTARERWRRARKLVSQAKN